jgi:hypothetical protein
VVRMADPDALRRKRPATASIGSTAVPQAGQGAGEPTAVDQMLSRQQVEGNTMVNDQLLSRSRPSRFTSEEIQGLLDEQTSTDPEAQAPALVGKGELEVRNKPGRSVPEPFQSGNFAHQYAEALRHVLPPPGIAQRFAGDVAAGNVIPLSQLPDGLLAERPIGELFRADRVTVHDAARGIIYEIKPDTVASIRNGQNQVFRSVELANQSARDGRTDWQGVVVVYNRRAASRYVEAPGAPITPGRSPRGGGGGASGGRRSSARSAAAATTAENLPTSQPGASAKSPEAEPLPTAAPEVGKGETQSAKPRPLAPSTSRPVQIRQEFGGWNLNRGLAPMAQSAGTYLNELGIQAMQNQELQKAADAVAHLEQEKQEALNQGKTVITVVVFDYRINLFEHVFREPDDVKRFHQAYLLVGKNYEEARYGTKAEREATQPLLLPGRSSFPPAASPRTNRFYAHAVWDVAAPPQALSETEAASALFGRWHAAEREGSTLQLTQRPDGIKAEFWHQGGDYRVTVGSWQPGAPFLGLVFTDDRVPGWRRTSRFEVVTPDTMMETFELRDPAHPEQTQTVGFQLWFNAAPRYGPRGLLR